MKKWLLLAFCGLLQSCALAVVADEQASTSTPETGAWEGGLHAIFTDIPEAPQTFHFHAFGYKVARCTILKQFCALGVDTWARRGSSSLGPTALCGMLQLLSAAGWVNHGKRAHSASKGPCIS